MTPRLCCNSSSRFRKRFTALLGWGEPKNSAVPQFLQSFVRDAARALAISAPAVGLPGDPVDEMEAISESGCSNSLIAERTPSLAPLFDPRRKAEHKLRERRSLKRAHASGVGRRTLRLCRLSNRSDPIGFLGFRQHFQTEHVPVPRFANDPPEPLQLALENGDSVRLQSRREQHQRGAQPSNGDSGLMDAFRASGPGCGAVCE